MPESPDFDQIARILVERFSESRPATARQDRFMVAEQLRQIWNARGAADLAELDHTFSAGLAPSMKVIDQILRALDR